MYQSTMAFTAFLMLLLFIMLAGILPVSAYPVSRPESDTSIHILSGIQWQGSAPTPTILPRDHEPVPSETTQAQTSNLASAIEDKETESDAQPSGASVSLDKEQTTKDGEVEEEGDHHGLNPNIIAGITVGVVFGVLLLIAALMYAFRVGWEKGQQQQEKAEMIETKQQPAPPILEPWHQIDTIRPPEVVLETGGSCWDSRSWSCCEEHTENYRVIGERYSFRPGKGVYEIRDPVVEDCPEVWPTGRTDSGLGLEYPEDAKGKGREKPPSN